MSEIDQQSGDMEPGSNKRKYMIIGIVLAGVLAIIIPLLVLRSSQPEVTLVSINDRLTAIEANLDGDIAVAKTDLAWAKEKIADLLVDTGDLDTELDGVLNKVNNLETKLVSMEGVLSTISSVVNSINTTLASCNCTCSA